ncbi:DNA-binding response regulator [Pullulanibacillus camelliae]|uniref:DNA-binding response regulator n=1 Tax=Pullulanibacillus camelliae TaxID=1707096 RepID=A0A8J2VN01_9BACL|nr:response regulator transcription factor [Pullulanibacillus camelliae]GGE31842.1 DNA-binding response regulator [Pullulanibacillus camelliae]
MAKVLLVDDEANIIDVSKRYLERDGFQVITASDGEEAMCLWRTEAPDLLVLDLMMPKKDGFQVFQEIRHEDDVPIIILTARCEEMDRLVGLTMGADDYLTKPFSPRELVLRAQTILRRVAIGRGKKPTSFDQLKYGPLHIDSDKRMVQINQQLINLTAKEFDLLWLLASHPKQVFSRNQLLERIWDFEYEGDTTTVTVHIRRLREKIEELPSKPRYIQTVWGIGYKFEGDDDS